MLTSRLSAPKYSPFLIHSQLRRTKMLVRLHTSTHELPPQREGILDAIWCGALALIFIGLVFLQAATAFSETVVQPAFAAQDSASIQSDESQPVVTGRGLGQTSVVRPG
jgi:hypothetical protein